MKRKWLITIAMTFILAATGSFLLLNPEVTGANSEKNKTSQVETKPEVKRQLSRVTQPISYRRGPLSELPKYDENSDNGWQVDIRSRDLSKLNLKDRLNDLMYADFDSRTAWPDNLPKEFDIKKIMEYGKNPGLNVRKLHEKGIKGNGVSIAIIDQTLLTEHEEYKDRLRLYEECRDVDKGGTSMHGSAVSSIAVGKTVGVAPGADLYYLANTHGDYNSNKEFTFNFTYLANAIERVLEINKTLPKENKIRVISMSIGWTPNVNGFKEVDAAVKKAKAEGLLVLSTGLSQYYDVSIMGLGRDSLKDPDIYQNYEAGLFWKKYIVKTPEKISNGNRLLIPMDSRCTAAPTGNSDYAFYRNGGLSWSIPYVAGLYALCCEVNPNITPEEFLKVALDTGDDMKIIEGHGSWKVVNPEKLIEKIKK